MGSGYTHCACRDCFEVVMSNDMANPDLCDNCSEAGCEPDSECCVEPELEAPECPACGGESTVFGALGNLVHSRCRNCGIDHSTEVA